MHHFYLVNFIFFLFSDLPDHADPLSTELAENQQGIFYDNIFFH